MLTRKHLAATAVTLAATASLTPLSLLVGDLVLMWAVATFRHARRGSGHVVAVVR